MFIDVPQSSVVTKENNMSFDPGSRTVTGQTFRVPVPPTFNYTHYKFQREKWNLVTLVWDVDGAPAFVPALESNPTTPQVVVFHDPVIPPGQYRYQWSNSTVDGVNTINPIYTVDFAVTQNFVDLPQGSVVAQP